MIIWKVDIRNAFEVAQQEWSKVKSKVMGCLRLMLDNLLKSHSANDVGAWFEAIEYLIIVFNVLKKYFHRRNCLSIALVKPDYGYERG